MHVQAAEKGPCILVQVHQVHWSINPKGKQNGMPQAKRGDCSHTVSTVPRFYCHRREKFMPDKD